MKSSKQPRAVVVTRPTWYEELLGRYGTREQARFFLQQRGQDLDQVEQQHRQVVAALQVVLRAIPIEWRRSRVQRDDLDRFLFEPDDIVVALGQDGLVANTAKYLHGQPVLGLNPSPEQYEGVLVNLPPVAAGDMLATIAAGRATCHARTMVAARLDDGQELVALNEIFVGHQSHQSARYEISWEREQESQSSSGVIISTGTGATGWARSIHLQRQSEIPLPAPTEPRLVFFVREAWPSRRTGTRLVDGSLEAGTSLQLTSRMNEGGVIFGDGIEEDRLPFSWGVGVSVTMAQDRLNHVQP